MVSGLNPIDANANETVPLLSSGDDKSNHGYIERKAMELKLTGIALNHSKNHIGERTTDKGVQEGIFLLKTRWQF